MKEDKFEVHKEVHRTEEIMNFLEIFFELMKDLCEIF
jgi:hypothetical protein